MYLLLTCLSPQYDYIPKTLGGGKKDYRWMYLFATAIAFSLFYMYSE